MKKSMIVGLLLLVAVVLVVSCTPKEAAPETASDTAAEEAPEELLGEEETGALAGQAINRGCRTVSVDSCVSNDDGSITVEVKDKIKKKGINIGTRTKNYGAKCLGSTALTYRCMEGGKPRYEYCRTQCEAGERCEKGQCVFQCTDSDDLDGIDNNGVAGQENERGTARGLPDANYSEGEQRLFTNQVAEITDYCEEERGILREAYCSVDNKLMVHGTVCETSGRVCQDGACVARPAPVNLCGNEEVDAGETCVNCAADLRCSYGCYAEENRCARVLRHTASCEGSVLVNNTYIEGSATIDLFNQTWEGEHNPITTRTDCANLIKGYNRHYYSEGYGWSLSRYRSNFSDWTCFSEAPVHNTNHTASCVPCGATICESAAGNVRRVLEGSEDCPWLNSAVGVWNGSGYEFLGADGHTDWVNTNDHVNGTGCPNFVG